MKVPFMIILLISVYPVTTYAQNKVTVSQNGDANSVSVNQGRGEQAQAVDCPETKIDTRGNNNTMKITTDGDNQKTVLHQSNSKGNKVFALLLDLHMLEALQQGDANSLLLSIPAKNKAPRSFSTSQHGERNTISARMPGDSAKIFVTQNGSENSVSVNPCKSKKQ